MAVLFSQIKTILPGNWSIIETPTTIPSIGDWRERQEGSGDTSQFIIEVYTEAGWETKFILVQ